MQNPKSAANGQTSSTSGAKVLDDIAAFIRRYLVCGDHQLNILTLWTACTHCYDHFLTAPYLHVRSPQPQCGKSLCLNLLGDLSHAGLCFTGAPAAVVFHRLIEGSSLDARAPLPSCPVLIDDYHHSFGPSERQPLIAFLNSGVDWNGCFAWGEEDYNLFSPKVLAGNSPLPRSLAARCIPIHLRCPKPSEKFLRYSEEEARPDVKALTDRLCQWLDQASPVLAQAANDLPPHLPATLSPGRRKYAEPLVHIADVAGETWPAKVRAALAAVFDLLEPSREFQMLSDLRLVFREKNDPECLATSDLLAQLRSLDGRPWSAWSANSGRRLADLLRPFGIMSRRFHPGSGVDFMGYLLNDFYDVWERYLPGLSDSVKSEPIQISSNANIPAQATASAIGAG